jgi:hypothetical protein
MRSERQWLGDRLVDADNQMHAHLARELGRGESKAERVIRARWWDWNAEGLQWGERMLKMKELGFNDFEKMPLNSFKSLCVRKLKLQYRFRKMTQI